MQAPELRSLLADGPLEPSLLSEVRAVSGQRVGATRWVGLRRAAARPSFCRAACFAACASAAPRVGGAATVRCTWHWARHLPCALLCAPSSCSKRTTTSHTPPLCARARASQPRLRSILATFASFPPKYRLLIWRALLRLPGNRLAFGGLRARGPHPSFADLPRRFPGLGGSQATRLARVLSCLAWWCPLLAAAPWVPSFAFPFVQLFGADDCGSFEACAAVLLNVLPGWLEQYPEPPMRLVALGEQAVAQADARLAHHCDVALGGTWRAVWHLMSTAFSDAFPAGEWAQVWDHLVCGPPVLAPCLAAAILLRTAPALTSVHAPAAADVLLRAPCGLNVEEVLRHAHQLAEARGGSLRSWQTPPVPLGMGAVYPAFGPVPAHQLAEAVDAAAEQHAAQQLEATASALASRVDGAASLQSAWDAEQRTLSRVRTEQTAQKGALEARLRARQAASAASALDSRQRALDLREEALRQQLLRERRAWHEALAHGAAEVDGRRRELDTQGAILSAEERLRTLEAEVDARDAAADVAASHEAARLRVAAQAAAAAAAQRLRGARFARRVATADDASKVARAHAAARRAAMAAARQEASVLAAGREAELQLQLAEEDAMANAMRERLRRDAAETEAAITAAAVEAERLRSVTAADASAAALSAQAALDMDGFATNAQRRAQSLARARQEALDGAMARDAAAASAAAHTRAASVAHMLAERRAALAAADAQAEVATQRALTLGHLERSRDEALAAELRRQAASLGSALGGPRGGEVHSHEAAGGGREQPASSPRLPTDDLSLRLERARRELAQAARDAAEAERTAAALRVLAEAEVPVPAA